MLGIVTIQYNPLFWIPILYNRCQYYKSIWIHLVYRNSPWRHLTQPRQCDSPKNTQHDTSKVLRLPCKISMEVSKVLCLPWKMEIIFWKHRKSIAPATQNDSWHVMKHVGISRSATPARRNEVTKHLKPPKVTTVTALPIGPHTVMLPTVADGCGRLRTKNSIERTRLNPQTPKVKREPFATHSGIYIDTLVS